MYKVILIGDSGSGKSSILNRFHHNEFNLNTKATIGIEFVTNFTTIDNMVIKTLFFDTAGQETFRTITKAYYRGSHGILLVYSVINRESFKNLKSWLKEVRNYNENPQIILIGNICDMKEARKVSTEEAQAFAVQENLLFMETSALNSYNVKEAFNLLINTIYKESLNKELEPKNNPIIEENSILSLENSESNKATKKGCC